MHAGVYHSIYIKKSLLNREKKFISEVIYLRGKVETKNLYLQQKNLYIFIFVVLNLNSVEARLGLAVWLSNIE